MEESVQIILGRPYSYMIGISLGRATAPYKHLDKLGIMYTTHCRGIGENLYRWDIRAETAEFDYWEIRESLPPSVEGVALKIYQESYSDTPFIIEVIDTEVRLVWKGSPTGPHESTYDLIKILWALRDIGIYPDYQLWAGHWISIQCDEDYNNPDYGDVGELLVLIREIVTEVGVLSRDEHLPLIRPGDRPDDRWYISLIGIERGQRAVTYHRTFTPAPFLLDELIIEGPLLGSNGDE